jgi:hypothetical protein
MTEKQNKWQEALTNPLASSKLKQDAMGPLNYLGRIAGNCSRLGKTGRKANAPSFSSGVSAPAGGAHPYTVETLAKFLGGMKHNGEVNNSFRAAFGAVELISEGYQRSLFGLRPVTDQKMELVCR